MAELVLHPEVENGTDAHEEDVTCHQEVDERFLIEGRVSNSEVHQGEDAYVDEEIEKVVQTPKVA